MLLGRYLTVRRGLTFIILLLAGLIQALMVVVLTSSLDKRAAGQELTRTGEIAGLLSIAAHHWALERSRGAIALATDAPPGPAVREAMTAARQSAADALEQARQALARSPDLRLKALQFSELEATLADIEPQRRADDAALAGSDSGDGLAQAHDRSAPYTRLIEKAQELARTLLSIGEDLEPSASLVRLQIALWTVEELAWREQAILGAASLGGYGLTAVDLERLGQIRGRQNQAWQAAEATAKKLPGAKLAAAMEAAGVQYFGTHRDGGAERLVLKRDGAGVIAVGEPWSPATRQALASLHAAQRAAVDATERAGADLAEVSEGAIKLGYTLLGGAMFGSLFALAIIHFGLYRPLSRLIDTADHLAQSEPASHAAVEIPSHRRQDELGALARTLGALQGRLGYRSG